MTERERPRGGAGDARPDDAGRAPEISVSNEPIAIVGMACRFPGADGLSAFWRLLEAGESGVIEGVPGSGEGRIGALFPDAAQAPACRFGAYPSRRWMFPGASSRWSRAATSPWHEHASGAGRHAGPRPEDRRRRSAGHQWPPERRNVRRPRRYPDPGVAMASEPATIRRKGRRRRGCRRARRGPAAWSKSSLIVRSSPGAMGRQASSG